MTQHHTTAERPPAPPETVEACRERIAALRDDIAAIKAQIAAADLDRQERGGRMDARWFHRAKTALRHKQRELETTTVRLAALAARGRDSLKDSLIAVVREDYDAEEWRAVLDEAHRRHDTRAEG
jgi:hypothetical protein